MSILDGEYGPSPDDYSEPSDEDIAGLEDEYRNEGNGHPELAGYYELLRELEIDEDDPKSYDVSDQYDKEYDVP